MSGALSQILAELVSASDHAVSGATIVAPAVFGEAILVVNWAHFEQAEPEDGDDGIVMSVVERVAPSVRALPAFTDLEREVVACAWSWGAWDIKRTNISAGYAGALPGYLAGRPELREQGYASWYFRPMMRAPDIRIKAWAGRDRSLDAWTLGRTAPAPDNIRMSRRADNEAVFRLGIDTREDRQPPSADIKPRRSRPKKRPATSNQIRYLYHLCRIHGWPEGLQANLLTLSFAAASAWIDKIKEPK
jgi:hypothetical protein